MEVFLGHPVCIPGSKSTLYTVDPDKGIEVDQDPERGSKWIRLLPNVEDLGGSGSATLVQTEEDSKPGSIKIFNRVYFDSC